ncbi:Mbov_0400 family ICE element protein [Mycoplasmopsis hyopharyngis]|uniref:Mbov_0400 family ICE element protein n=1 Tax=Mycoplasmopsis hyopharyngis TaxID=29558 RepID=UPI00387324CC
MKFVRIKKDNFKEIETNFDKNGKVITKNNQYITHPVILFVTDKNVYYLNARSATKNNTEDKKNKFKSEIELHFEKDKSSYVDMSSIQIMNKEDFFTIYDKSKIFDLNNYQNSDEKKEFYKYFFNFLSQHKEQITIQEIKLEKNPYKTYSNFLHSDIEKIYDFEIFNYIQTTCSKILALKDIEFDEFINNNYLPTLQKKDEFCYIGPPRIQPFVLKMKI